MLKPVTFYSEGVKLAGDLFLPADIKPGERRAGIVLCHGYTGVRSIYLPDNARVLAEAGYVVLTFDYKGWGDSDGAKTRLACAARTSTMICWSAPPRTVSSDVTDVVKDIPRLGPQDVMRGVIERFDALKDRLADAAAKGHGKPVSQVRLRAPLLKPENAICMAVNYMEDGTLSEPAPMNAFMKSPSAIIGDGDTMYGG